MEYRTLGNSPVQASAVTFGAWAIGGWMWGGSDRADAIEAIRASFDEGVTSIDTAPIYGQGHSEVLVGEAIKGIPREKVQLLTKFGMRWDTRQGDFAFHTTDNDGNPLDVFKYAAKESVIRECEDSLRRLGTDYIDLLQIHWPDKTTPVSETMEALEILLQQGKIRAAGVSNYSAELLKEARQTLAVASDQVPYSMVERSIEKELVPYCLETGTSIIAYSPLQRGLLTGKIKPDHVFAPGDHRPGTLFYRPENIRRINAFLDKIRPLAGDKGVSLSQLVIRWTIDRPGITVALAGARNAAQAAENARAAAFSLAADERNLIDTALGELVLES
ncbi:aldo/keto reductase [Siphonobacter aquaeclarae]|uniref:Predicted oxidoreductase n=1 Tax=Siphonobacter aquaeclarae TaxID=563176 RepID=A0A1G9UMH0_9BACT|nr:aldo/keto reductase [Siphonobacter aquaeclarae]SDM61152.1 Predicted oxidoreductase [Siphonobacter aquaeclarae]